LGVLFIDVNGDGKPDIYVANDMDDKFLYVNRSRRGRLMFEEQALSARVVVEAGGRRQTGFARGGSYLSSCDRRHIFGLGPAGEVERVRVVWPSGKAQEWQGLSPDRYWRLIEGEERAGPLDRDR
jgi:hypothetical protein